MQVRGSLFPPYSINQISRNGAPCLLNILAYTLTNTLPASIVNFEFLIYLILHRSPKYILKKSCEKSPLNIEYSLHKISRSFYLNLYIKSVNQ